MRTASSGAFCEALSTFRATLDKARSRRLSLATDRVLAPKAREQLALLRKTFLVMQADFPEARYPGIAFQIAVLKPLLDSVIESFPAKLKDMADVVQELEFKVGSDLAAALDAPPSPGPSAPEAPFLPDDLVDSRQGVFKKVLWEVNRSYDAACYNACATMLRRLVEGLIVEAFERTGHASKIKDEAGDYLDFSALIGQAIAEPTLRLTRNTKRVLPSLKFFGDLGAHNRMALVRKADLDRLHDDARAAIEELSRAVASSA